MLSNLSKYDIILGSGSPRRRELLTQLGIRFRVQTIAGIDETFPTGLSPEDTARHIVSNKAAAFRRLLTTESLIITADTIVCADDEVMGKPTDAAAARGMLQRLSGRAHQVVTGVNVMTANRTETIAVTTNVTFGTLTADEIDYYVATFKPFDKAGAYGIQEWIGMAAVESIDGSYWNVMGLPVHQLYLLLKTF